MEIYHEQAEESFGQRIPSAEDDDYDEVAEIEPMKPLQVNKSYLLKDKPQSSVAMQGKTYTLYQSM